jgi:beta-phosphoglucomutase-like phosphatase (HAD superfamily)
MLFAIIFDLDGVLSDSEPWWSQIDAKLLAKYGVTYRGEYHQNVVGVSYRIAVEFYKKAFGLSVPTEEMMRRRGEIATEFFANRVGLFPKVEEVLQELRQMKLHLAVATSSLSASARPFLDRHQLTGFFQVIVTGEEVERGKPAPDIDLRAADKLALWLRTRFPASPRPRRRTCAPLRFPTGVLSILTSTRKKPTTSSVV